MMLRLSEPSPPLAFTGKPQPNRSARSCGYRFPGCCQRVFHIDHAVWLLAWKYSRTGMRCLPPAATTLAASPSTSGSWTQKRCRSSSTRSCSAAFRHCEPKDLCRSDHLWTGAQYGTNPSRHLLIFTPTSQQRPGRGFSTATAAHRPAEALGLRSGK